MLRLNRTFVPRLKSNLAAIFSTDYIGAFVGAVVWVYVLLRHFPLTEISFLVAGMNFAVALATYAYFSYHRAAPRGLSTVAIILVAAAGLAYGYSRNRDWNRALEQRFYSEPVAHSVTTRYQHIVLTASADPVDYRLYINGNLQFSSLDERIYHEMLVHPAMTLAASRSRVLILGGGDGLALREVLKHGSVREVTLVDIDPGMIEFARSHDVMTALNEGAFRDARVSADAIETAAGVVPDRPLYDYAVSPEAGAPDVVDRAARVGVYTIDADKILRDLEGVYDVILIDLPDPNSVEMVKLYSREFYLKLNRLTAPGATIALQSTSPYHAKESFLCILRTVRSAGYRAMPYHDNVPSFGDWGWILAWNSGETEAGMRDRIRDMERFASREEQLSYLTPDRLRAALSFGKGGLVAASSEINTLMMPVLLRLYLTESWDR